VDPARVFLLGESLGGAVALELALEHRPAGLVLLSAFTGIRALAALHYPFVPGPLVPDAYPSLRRIRRLETPVLVIHGEEDEVAPVEHGRALYEAARGAKRLRVFQGAGHNDLLALAGGDIAREIATWADSLGTATPR
jgi:pimeloyl-ACP methyl ester carboxylesterase